MDKTTLGLFGAAASLVLAAGPAAATPVAPASSFADLLSPIANAVARLKADDEARAGEPETRSQDPRCVNASRSRAAPPVYCRATRTGPDAQAGSTQGTAPSETRAPSQTPPPSDGSPKPAQTPTP